MIPALNPITKVGSFTSQESLSALLFGIAGVFESVAGLAYIGDRASHKLRASPAGPGDSTSEGSAP